MSLSLLCAFYNLRRLFNVSYRETTKAVSRTQRIAHRIIIRAPRLNILITFTSIIYVTPPLFLSLIYLCTIQYIKKRKKKIFF